MRAWASMLGGLIVWTVHFFSIYAIASIFLTSTLARILTVIVTIACLAADGVLFRRSIRPSGAEGGDEVTRWMRLLASLGAAISFVAVLWQGLPAFLI